MRPVRIPAALLGLLLLMAAVFAVQGWRMAADRQARLVPTRAGAIVRLGEDAPAAVRGAGTPTRLLVDPGDDPPARLALYQLLAERPLLRWLEAPGAPRASWLVIPLEGLGPGRYAVCAADADANAGPREMDLPELQLDVRTRFELE